MTGAIAFTHATVVTADANGTVENDQTLLIGDDGVIERVGPSREIVVPQGYKVVNASGRYLVPGLINAHAHLFSDGKPLPAAFTAPKAERAVAAFMHGPLGRRYVLSRARQSLTTQLNSGVTTLRTLGDVGYEVVGLRNDIEAGAITGPRVLASGPMMAVTGGHGAPLVSLVGDGPWQVRRNVRQNLRAGVTAIKIAATGGVTDAHSIGEAGRPQMTEVEMRAICEEAHSAGLIVAAHAQSTEGVLRSLRAGVDTIEHGAAMNSEVVDLFHHNPRSLTGSSALIPTLNAGLPLVKLDRSVTGIGAVTQANSEIIVEQMLQAIADARHNDVTLGIGTDSAMTYVTQYNTWRELDYVVRYGGLTAVQALHAATGVNARILGLDSVTGSISTGKSADLVLLRANPLDDLRAFINPELVVVRGAIINHPQVERFEELESQLDSF